MLKLRRDHGFVGEGHHRSGWPFVMRAIADLHRPDGILFDDFVDQSFSSRRVASPHTEPWIGVFHEPPAPAWRRRDLTKLLTTRSWLKSARHLRLAIATSNHLAAYLRRQIEAPVAVIPHPTDFAIPRWSLAAFRENPQKRILQIGWFLRNTRAIHQVPPVDGYRKVRLWRAIEYTVDYDAHVKRYWQRRKTRTETGEVTDRPLVDVATYDALLAENVVLTEVFAASANNVVLECIARNTPLLINRHPAVEEHLGADYPLYFDAPAEVPGLLAADRILAAHAYLLALDKRRFTIEAFREALLGHAASLQRERRRGLRRWLRPRERSARAAACDSAGSPGEPAR